MAPLDHINAAIAELKQTTVGYLSAGKCKHVWTVPPAGSHWANGLSELNAAIAELTVPPPPPPPPPPSGLLLYRPPGYVGGDPRASSSFPGFQVRHVTSPGTITLTGGDYYIYVDQALSSTNCCIELAGSANNIVIIGGDLRGIINAQSDANHAYGIIVRGTFTGTIHLEGLRIASTQEAGIALQTPEGSTVQIQNCWVEAHQYQDINDPVHADVIQNWGSDKVKIDRFTGYTDRQGFLWSADPNASGDYPNEVWCSHVDLHAMPPQPNSISPTLPLIGGAMVWHVSSDTIFHTDANCWMETGWYSSSYHRGLMESIGVYVDTGYADACNGLPYHEPPYELHSPDGATIYTSSAPIPDCHDRSSNLGRQQGNYITWARWAPLAQSQWRWGIPPSGEFCPAASVGQNYVSPGYQS